MPSHRETRVLPYTTEQMYDLVADIRRYPEFLPWVIAMRVRSETREEALADMIVGFKGIRETFTSRVRKTPNEEICVEYIEGPLKYLRNDWRFVPNLAGCAVDFSVEFAFKNKMFEMLAGQVFGSALRKMIGAFERRANALYGDQSDNSSSSAKSAA